VEHFYDVGGSIVYSNTALTNHLQSSAAIETKSKVLAEWNLNIFENIEAIGNYKNRPAYGSPDNTLPDTWVMENENTPTANRKWYGFTDYDTVIDGGYTDEGLTPVTFQTSNERQKALMSLEDCFKRFRPRSGINKLRAKDNGKYILPAYSNNIFARPRYYPAGRNDNFKYWSSFRSVGTENFGISKSGSPYLIQDAAPFVVYKNQIPTNKVVIKLQTNVSGIDSGALIDPASPSNKDPFFINSTTNYKSTPLSWKVQKYNGTNWIDIYTTTSDVFTTPDGYFELSYGLTNSEIFTTYKDKFLLIGTLTSTSALPSIKGEEFKGQSYLIKSSNTDKGTIYIHNGGTSSTNLNNFNQINPSYGWYKSEESISNAQLFVKELDKTIAPSYLDNETLVYREFENIQGLRIVVNRMVNERTTFDLIELSPRLAVDLTDVTSSFSLKKYASDLGVSSLPVGQLLASNGDMSIFDYNEVFNQNNKNSLLNVYSGNSLQFSFITKNLQLKFYETISKVKQTDNSYKDYHIPLKTMYADGFPQYDDSNRNITITLRDFVFYLESQIAPEIFLTNASISYIIATLLDSIGFSNYSFKRLPTEKDTVIPNFFISPNKTVMQVLQDIAIATQTTMFFDESNNLIVMGKRYLVPDSTADRDFDIMLYGSDTEDKKTNIANISSQSNDIYNDGKITYYNRYIRKKSNDTSLETLTDTSKTISYESVVLWAVNDLQDEATVSKNEEKGTFAGYPLTAMALASKLTSAIPKVVNQKIINNEMDFGDNIYWLARPTGYLYANGEIIRYDAQQYNVGNETVWIRDSNDYAKYYSQLSLGQKMYPTGLLRIYAEPKYNSDGTYVENTIAKHGRGQFGTTIAEHTATYNELDYEWKTPKTPLVTDWQHLFNSSISSTITADIVENKTNLKNTKMKPPTTTIKNFLSLPKYNVNTKNYEPTGTLQASALLLTGPNFTVKSNNGPSINYVKKDLGASVSYDTFGTRIRLLGTPQIKETSKTQRLSGSYPLYTSANLSAPVNGESGGIGVLTNTYGEGYYYEIVALNYADTKNFTVTDSIDAKTVLFYRMNMVKDGYTTLSLDGTFSQNNTVLTANNNRTLTTELGNNPVTFSVGKLIEVRNETQAALYSVVSMGSGSSPWILRKEIPVLKPTKLFSDFANILVDSGKFAPKVKRLQDSTEDSVYDLGIRVSKVNNKDWRLSIYLNGSILGTVQDKEPVTYGISQNISLFTRGSSQVMFNDAYAIKTLKKKPAASEVKASSEVFNGDKTSNLTYSKYSVNTLIKSGFLSNLSASEIPENSIYYEEFGTVMRECAYFNVKFDKAYPALVSKIAPQPASISEYVVTGYNSTPYRAEFLVFNTSDFALSLGNGSEYDTVLNIVGITYTEEVARELTVDGFYSNRSNFSSNSDYSSQVYKNRYAEIKNNRINYGNKSFAIDSPYIQSEDTATELMEYIINKISKPRKAVAVETFGMPIIQLGDLVKFSYDTGKTLPNAVTGNNFVVYAIEHQTAETGPSTIIYLSEVS
jgi:hypothetical protein